MFVYVCAMNPYRLGVFHNNLQFPWEHQGLLLRYIQSRFMQTDLGCVGVLPVQLL